MHKTNSPKSQGNITYAVLPDGSADVWIRKNEVQLPEKDEGPQGMEADEIYFKVSAGVGIWDYSNMPFNIIGQICLPFTVAWYILSLLAIVLDDHLRYWIFGEEKPRYKWR